MSRPLTLYLVAGEMSGDTHGAALMRALRERVPDVVFHGAGGPRMRALAGNGFLDWSTEAVVGLWDVLRKYGYFKKRLAETLREIADTRPDAVVFIDYPGFNLRLAAALAKRRDPALRIDFISPQVWAWNRGRVPKMARILDLMLCIFPFEKALYEQSGLRTVFVGHPLKDEPPPPDTPREPNLIALLPGSREREVRKIFPVLARSAALLSARHPGLQFAAAAASENLVATMRAILDEHAPGVRCEVRVKAARDLMLRATAGAVASGTATMEAALCGLPFVLVYRVARPTWWIARYFVRVPHLGMPNLLAGREIVREFLQDDLRPEPLADALESLWSSGEKRAALRGELRAVIDGLGPPGCAGRAAEAILDLLKTNSSRRGSIRGNLR